MKTRKIEQKVFEEIQKKSFETIESELRAAAKHLSRLAGKNLELVSTNEDYVIYKPEDQQDVFLKARYKVTDRGTIKLNNFEKIIVDESSKNEERKNILRNVINALMEDDPDAATDQWKELKNRFPVSEMVKKKASGTGKAPGDGGVGNADEEDQESKGKARCKRKEDSKYGSHTSSSEELMTLKAVDDSLEEWADSLPNFTEIKKYLIEAAKSVAKIVCEEKTDVIKIKMKDKKDKKYDKDDMKYSKKDKMKYNDDDDDDDDDDDIDEIEIDTKDKADKKEKTSKKSKKQREKVKKARTKMKYKEDDKDFEESIVSLKRNNNAKDEESLEDTISEIVSSNPQLIYISKNELKEMISRILTKREEKNWDEDLCEEIAFGLKKVAHNTYADQAYDLIKFAAVDEVVGLDEEVSDDDYEAFEQVSERYFENVYAVAKKKYDALRHLSEMLSKSATTLEGDVKAAGLDASKIIGTVSDFREYASQVAASARNLSEADESIVRMVVGSLLSRASNDYSLNQSKFVDPGHFHTNFDLDADNYKQHAKGGTKDAMLGDEESSISNPMSPGSMGPDKLDLEKTASSKGFDVMKFGIHSNPTVPGKAMSASQLDLD